MRGRGMREQVFLDGVLVQSGDGGQAARGGGPGPAFGFQVAGAGLDIGATSREQVQAALVAPGS